jgi:hypothetical protein
MTRPEAGPEPAVKHSLLFRMAALGPSAADVVRFAGGWLFDQGMAGWEVNVLTRDRSDPRPLQILGACVHDLDTMLASPAVRGACLQAIAVRADLYDSDARVRQIARNVLETGSAELRLWGDLQAADLEHGAEPVRHELSSAARAFKAQALAAARLPAETVADAEEFHRRHRTDSCRPRRPAHCTD